MMQFLSAEWLSAVDAAVREATFDPDTSVVIEQVVTGTPDGDVSYRLVVEAGAGRIVAGVGGPADRIDVTITMPWPLAVDVRGGRASAQQAFLHGGLRLGGDVRALIEHADVAETLSRVLASVPAATPDP